MAVHELIAKSILSTDAPLCFARTPGGEIFMSNGVDRARKYVIGTGNLYLAGLDSPASTTAFAALSGTVASGIGQGTYGTTIRYFDGTGNYSDIIYPLQSVATTAANYKLTWSSTPLLATAAMTGDKLTASQATGIEFLRTLVNSPSVLYSVGTVSASIGTTYDDTFTDAQLSTRGELLLENDDGTANALRYGVPPVKEVCAWYQDRMFYLVDRKWSHGTLSGTNGGSTVSFTTTLPDDIVGRTLTVQSTTGNSLYEYEIAHRLSATTASIVGSASVGGFASTAAWSGLTFCISGGPQEANTVYYSEQDEPESVPVSQNRLPIQGSGDRLVGACPNVYGMILFRERSSYRMSYVKQPHLDANIQPIGARGAFNNRCWAQAGDMVFAMDRYGPYMITGQGIDESIGVAVQNYFRDGKVRFSDSDKFFVAVDLRDRVAKFFLTLNDTDAPTQVDSSGRPRRAICYDYIKQRWYVEWLPWTVGAATNVRGYTDSSIDKFTIGSWNGLLLSKHPDITSDGCSSASVWDVVSAGTSSAVLSAPTTDITAGYYLSSEDDVCTLVDESGALPLTDEGATAGASISTDLLRTGASLLVGTGSGRWQVRTIQSVSTSSATLATVNLGSSSGTTANLVAWDTAPSAADKAIVGGVYALWRSGMYEIPDGGWAGQSLDVRYRPLTTPVGLTADDYSDIGGFAIQYYVDWSDSPKEFVQDVPATGDAVPAITAGQTCAFVNCMMDRSDSAKNVGLARLIIGNPQIEFGCGDRAISFDIQTIACAGRLEISTITARGY